MNRYPAWKFVLIAIALVFGLIYTLPNFFPEVPAVQVSSSKSAVRIDNALMVSVEEALKGAGIAYRGAEMDPIGIKVRFADTDTQLKAKDVLQTKLGDNYIVALNLLSASPRWLAAIGRRQPPGRQSIQPVILAWRRALSRTAPSTHRASLRRRRRAGRPSASGSSAGCG